MGAEQAGGECLEVDMINVYELGNRDQGKFSPKEVQKLLDSGYDINYDHEYETYSIKTYVSGTEYNISFDASELDNDRTLIQPEALIQKVSEDFVFHTVSDGSILKEELLEKYDNNMAYSSLFGMYKRYTLSQYGLLGDEKSNSSWTYDIQVEIDRSIREYKLMGEKSNIPNLQKTIQILESTTPDNVLNDFEETGFSKLIEELASVKEKSFDQRREDYVEMHNKKGITEICNNFQLELGELKQQVALSYISISDLEGKLKELETFLDLKGFQYDSKNDKYVGIDGDIVLSFRSDESTGFVSIIKIEKSPSGGHLMNVDVFIRDYNEINKKKI